MAMKQLAVLAGGQYSSASAAGGGTYRLLHWHRGAVETEPAQYHAGQHRCMLLLPAAAGLLVHKEQHIPEGSYCKVLHMWHLGSPVAVAHAPDTAGSWLPVSP